MVVPLLTFFALACVQFAILFNAYVNVVNATRDAARWITVHPHEIDSDMNTRIRNRRPPALVANNLTLTFSPACSSLSSGKCTGRDAGANITVTASYVITPHLFLPATFGFGNWVINVPTTLPTYSLTMQVEPL